MRKLFALLLVFGLMAGLLAGCGESQDVSGNISALEKEETTALAPEAEVTEEEEVIEVTEATAEETLVGFGRMEGGIYTNSYAGFGCTLDEKWSFYTAQELQELPENTQELYADTEMGEISDQYALIYDMMAENITDMTSMNVLYTKLGLQDRLMMASMSEEDIIDSTLSTKADIIEAYTQAGMENISIEKATVTFLGEEHPAIRTTATLQGMNYYIVQIVDYSRGSYGITLSVSSFGEDVTQDLLSLFYEV